MIWHLEHKGTYIDDLGVMSTPAGLTDPDPIAVRPVHMDVVIGRGRQQTSPIEVSIIVSTSINQER